MCRREGHRPTNAEMRTVDRAEHILVLDTNVVLDLLLFGDPQTTFLQEALLKGHLRWCATSAMRDELVRVLAYPHIALRLQRRACQVGALLQTFDRQVTTVPMAPRASCVCKDPDDQKFIDLAVEHRACLLSKDSQVLRMARRLERLGVTVARTWGEVHEAGRPVPTAH